MSIRMTKADREDDEDVRRRVQLDLAPDAITRLRRLKEMTSATSYAEVVRDSLRAYEWMVSERDAGRDIGVVKDGLVVEVVKLL